ncbi:MAG: PfkB family carbohydrate kinase, partial [Phycisphaerales bacterium]|nr:PfkB family carbohydrate kinase [Phycisphaerales bacterium]
MSEHRIQPAAHPGKAFLEAVTSLGGGRVLLVGDLMLDETVRGGADRLSPDAPVPVLLVGEDENTHARQPGGTGNVAACLRALNTEVEVVGLVGRDEAGTYLRGCLAESGCGIDGVLEDSSRPTTVKRSLVGLAQHRHPQKMFRMDIESRRDADQALVDAMLEAVEARLDDVDVVCIEDYAKGVCTPALCRGVIERCRARNLPVLVDPAALDDYSRYAGATAITPNRKEAELAAGTPGQGVVDLQAAANLGGTLREQHGF